MVQKICCLVFRKHKIKGLQYLLLHKKLKWKGWEFVKGEVRDKESLIDAVKREILQETGLHTKITGFEPFNYSYSYIKGLNFVDSEVACFVAEAKSDDVGLSEEHSHHKWADYDNAIKLIDFEGPKNLLKTVNARLNNTFI